VQRPRAGFTLFHVFWIEGILISALGGYALARHATLFFRLAITLAAGALGVIVCHVALVLLVIYVVIPRLKRGSGWQIEVDGFMRSTFGRDWPD